MVRGKRGNIALYWEKVGKKAARFLVSHQGRSDRVWAVWYPIGGGVDYVAIDLYHHGSGILLDSICTKQ